MSMGFEVGACVDLGTFTTAKKDYGVAEFVEKASRNVEYVVLMEDRAPDFFHGYRGYDPGAPVPLNRHGPNWDAWTQADLLGLVRALQAEGVRVLLGYWIHECAWVDERHPELLMRHADGTLWSDPVRKNADFNPMKPMHADPEMGIAEGTPYAHWATEQYKRLQADFGFDGLFLGDGGMGFRQHGHDEKGLTTFDFSDAWLSAFTSSATFQPHPLCALLRHGPLAATPAEKAECVMKHHWEEWVEWNVSQWTEYYAHTARAVHERGGKLAAYNVMNFDPALAYVHGVDYRALAEAGLDYLIFQAYDFAWGDLGPFGFLKMRKKDIRTNLEALLATRAYVGHGTRMKIFFTAETNDSVEHWDSPVPHTLGEVFAYGGARSFDGSTWRPVADGAFIVWASDVPREEFDWLNRAFDEVSRPREPSGDVLVWDEAEHLRMLIPRIQGRTTVDEIYEHHAAFGRMGPGHAPGGVMRIEDVKRAKALATERNVPVKRPADRARAEQ